jgi:hypothetical protein
MTAHADGGSDFKTQHVLERNPNIKFGLVFWPKANPYGLVSGAKTKLWRGFCICSVRWGTDFVPNFIILVFEYGTVFRWRGGDALRPS